MRKVLPFLHEEYFQSNAHKLLFGLTNDYITNYNARPNSDALVVMIDEYEGLDEDDYKHSVDLAKELDGEDTHEHELQWLLDQTERFCQDRAIYNALMESINIADGEDKKRSKGAIPEILNDALAVSFDAEVGHDYFDDYEERWEEMHREEAKIPFDVEYFNEITGGGFSTKTLNVLMAGTGVGKTASMCHFAASNLSQGKDVLYITLEMSKYNIANRIDANLLNVPLDELDNMAKQEYVKRMERLKKTVQRGTLKVKEYPPVSASATHFKHLLSELSLKKRFKPDIIYLDYLNICTSSRLGGNSNVNSYEYVKAIAEEIRGLAVEHDIPLVTATQTNRSGYASADVELDDVSESFGLPMTSDFMVAMMTNDELEQRNEIIIKQLKNRYMDRTAHKKQVVGLDYSKMRMFDVQEQDIVDKGSEVTDEDTGPQVENDGTDGGANRSRFEGFNV